MAIGRSYRESRGAVTATGRRQQLAVAAWILGWLGGPVPAIVIALVRPGRGAYRRLVTGAIAFWTVMMIAAGVVLTSVARTASVWWTVAWYALLLLAAVATGAAIRHALRGIDDPGEGSGLGDPAS